MSVIATDFLYLGSLLYTMGGRITTRVTVLYLWIPFTILDSNSLHMIDIHFQYNIMMQAILILSVGLMNRKKYLKAAFTFAILLNFKHIYMYCAPAYFIYLIKCYIFNKNNTKPLQTKTEN
jgi:alpha-1,3-glucosyltransferase